MVVVITEAKDLNELKLEDLIGSLKTHEAIIQDDKPQKKGKMIALKIVPDEGSSIQKKETSTSKDKLEINEHPQEEAEDEHALISIRNSKDVQKKSSNRIMYTNSK